MKAFAAKHGFTFPYDAGGGARLRGPAVAVHSRSEMSALGH